MMPPPLDPLVTVLVVMVFPRTWAVDEPTMAMPPPPTPPLQIVNDRTLLAIVFLSITGDPDRTNRPPPSHDTLSRMMLFRTIGDASRIQMPPPSPKEGVANVARPLRIVKPSITDPAPSPDANVTTEPEELPSMIVAAAPSVLRTVIAFPAKSIRPT